MKRICAILLCLIMTFTCTISLADEKKIAPTKITIENPAAGKCYVAVGKKKPLLLSVYPKGASRKVIWESSNSAVATVTKGGSVIGKKPGTVTITAVSKMDKAVKGKIKVTVLKKSVKTVKISGSIDLLDVNGKLAPKTVKLSAKAVPSSAAQSFTWESGSVGLAMVDNKGNVTADKPGKVIIYAYAADGSDREGKYEINIISSVESITVNGVNYLYNSESSVFTADIYPAHASNPGVTWRSSNTDLASVDTTGKVTAAGTGTGEVTIYATATDGTEVVGSKTIEILKKPTEDQETAETVDSIQIISPSNGDGLPADNIVITWRPVTNAACYEIAVFSAAYAVPGFLYDDHNSKWFYDNDTMLRNTIIQQVNGVVTAKIVKSELHSIFTKYGAVIYDGTADPCFIIAAYGSDGKKISEGKVEVYITGF